MDVLFETEPFKTVRFSVIECDTPEEAEARMKKWFSKKNELNNMNVNKRIIKVVME